MTIVKPDGPRHAKIFVIGEAPGETEISEGKNFVGKTEKLLWLIGQEAGLRREECKVGNIVWVRPPENDIKRLGELGVGLHDFLPELRNEILLTNPSVILAVGETALNALTGMSGISRYRGSVLPCSLFPNYANLPVVPTFHPSFLVKGNQEHRLSVKSDILKTIRISNEGFVPPQENFLTFSRGTTFEGMMIYLERIEKEAEILFFDTEGNFPKLDLISMCFENCTAISVPLNGQFSPDEEHELYFKVKSIMEGRSFKVAQNILHDCEVFRTWGIGIRNFFFDTMLGHKCLQQDLPHSLAYLTSIETNFPFYKDDRKKVSEPILVEDYSCRDALVLKQITFSLLKQIERNKLKEFFFSVEMEKVAPTARMVSTGARVDESTRIKMLEEKNLEISNLQKELLKFTKEQINPKSPKQMCSFLYEKLKCPRQYNKDKKTGEKRLTADEDAIVAIMKARPDLKEPLKIVLKLRQLGLLCSTFLEAIQIGGRWYTSYNIGGTSFGGRYSSSKRLDKTGISSQNIPKEVRKCIIPEDDESVIWEADSKQAEARFVVWRAGEESLFQAFMENRDVHRITASIILEKPEDEVTKLEREIAKRIHHGTNYLMGPRKLTEIITKELPDYSISEAKTKIYIERIHKARPATYAWACRIRDSLQRGNRIFRNPFGRRRLFLSIFSENDEMTRDAVAFEPQSTVGDLVSMAIGKVQKEFGPKSIIFNVHDSIMGSCKKSLVPRVKEVVKEAMEMEIPNVEYKGIPLSIPCEFKVGPNWGELKEI